MQRAKCQCCGKQLRYSSRRMTVPKGEKPTKFSNEKDYPERTGQLIYKIISRRLARYGQSETHEELVCWMGEYEGYGRGIGVTAPLFCTLRCALDFAQSAHRAGFR